MTTTILVIDDSEDDHRLYQRAFKDFDYELIPASSAESGFAHIANASPDSKCPDLILIDYNLPDMDGLSFMKRLAEYSDTPIPIVMLTGENNAAVAVEAMKNGVDDYIVKDTNGLYLRLLPGVVGHVMAAHEQREQTQRLRQETETLLRRNQTLMQNSMDGIHVMDMQGNIMDANDSFCNMLGYTPEEMALLNVADWDAHWSVEELRELFKELIGKNTRFETVHRRKDGSLIDVEVSTSGMEIDGRYFLFAASRDITERKKTEAILKKHKLVIDSANEGYWMTDAMGNLLNANKAYARMSGYSIDELTKMHISQLEATEQHEEVAAHIAKIIAQGHDRFETRHRRKDGQVIDIEISATFMPEMQQFFVFCRDITERKKAADALNSMTRMLRESRQLLDSIVEHIPVMVFVKRASDLRFELFNRAGEKLLGYSRSDLLGKGNYDFWSKEQADWFTAADRKVLASEEVTEIPEEPINTSSGETRYLHTWKVALRDEGGEPAHLLGISIDITERKKVEDELRVAAVAFETHDAILITDSKANIVRVNQAFTDITGYSPEEVLGQNPRIMGSGLQDKAFYIEMWQQLLHTGSWAGEIFDKRKNGQVYPKWLNITAVRNERQETTHYVAIFSDITARKHAEEEIRNLAFYDSLTQLPNRRLFMDRFRAALTISTRRNDYGAVLFIDLDRFKTLNDTLGHDYGDLLLIEVAARIKSCVREIDTVARLGGDEFVVLIEGINEDQVETSRKIGLIAEKIRETLAQPYELKSHEHYSSPSIGISLYRGNENPVDELLQQADMAMYQAKGAGRNAVRFFDPVMQHNVAMRAALENDLHQAVALGQLQLHYQVQVDNGHRPVGAEALLRWFHPEHGVVMPGQLIPIAEESTLILDIGHWVLDQACRQLALWAEDERMRDLTLAVNVSAKQFARPNFVEQVAEVIKSHQFAPSSLTLELTESMVLHDKKITIDTMHALKKLGVKLSMDDFGTGYSSLSCLRELPLDQLKIDQSFIQNITRDGNDAMLVQTIIDLGDNFRMSVIAEGVETEAQLTFLKHHDCMAFQGFLFSKALPIGEFEKLLDFLRDA